LVEGRMQQPAFRIVSHRAKRVHAKRNSTVGKTTACAPLFACYSAFTYTLIGGEQELEVAGGGMMICSWFCCWASQSYVTDRLLRYRFDGAPPRTPPGLGANGTAYPEDSVRFAFFILDNLFVGPTGRSPLMALPVHRGIRCEPEIKPSCRRDTSQN
jgi:hypothetical protein